MNKPIIRRINGKRKNFFASGLIHKNTGLICKQKIPINNNTKVRNRRRIRLLSNINASGGRVKFGTAK
jgi:hypothetical protein